MERTINDFLEGDEIPADQSGPLPPIPEWINWEKYKKGKEFFERYSCAILLSNFISLMLIYMSPMHMYPMRVTGQVDSPEKSARRYLFTAVHVKRWYQGDIFNPQDRAHASLVQVRRMHSHIMSKVNTPGGKKVYLSQCDMAFTQALFMGLVTMYPEKMGVPYYTKTDLEGFIHFWRVIGYMLNIDDKYNICSNGYDGAIQSGHVLIDNFARKMMRNLPEEFDESSQIFIQGFQQRSRRVNRNSILKFLYYVLGEQFPFKMSLSEWMGYFFLRFLLRYGMRFQYLRLRCNKLTLRILDFCEGKYADEICRSPLLSSDTSESCSKIVKYS